MNKIILDKSIGDYNIIILNAESNKMVNTLGHTKYKKDAERAVKLIRNCFNIDKITKNTNTTQYEQIINTIENESSVIMKAVKTLFPNLDAITENKKVYSQLVNLKDGEKNFKKFILDKTIDINKLDNKEQILFLCNWN